ncbi:hypothetical protein GCM10027570_30300 [Streptomonospora sediminis]
MTNPGYDAASADQQWFWTEEWQEGEREASRQISAGETTVYNSAEEMFDDLDR